MITEIKDEIFEKYQVRKSKKQKTAFIEYIKDLCEEKGIPCEVEEKDFSRNIVMGTSPADSEVVMTAHYDTCAKMIIPNFITPKNFLFYLVYQLLLIGSIIAVAGLAGWLCLKFVSDSLAPLAFMIFYLVFLILIFAGPANKHTANDNTSGVITVLNTMLSMNEAQRAKVCFVLFDNEESGLLGSYAFKQMHRAEMKDKPLLNFDCVSDGEYIFAKIPKKDKKSEFGVKFKEVMEKNIEKYGMNPVVGTSGFYPSDQTNFRHGVGIASLKKSKILGLYMNRIHTSKDTVFEERNIECLTSAMLEFIEE